MEELTTLNIGLDHIEEDLFLTIDSVSDNSLFRVEDYLQNSEAQNQLIEGHYYSYEFSRKDVYFQKDKTVQPHTRNKYLGTISPNIYVGTLALPVYRKETLLGEVFLEVRSVKTDYRNDYRDMLEFITEKCTDLILQSDSPVSHQFEVDYEKNNETLYQKFAFLKSILDTDEFADSVNRILNSPVTNWKESQEVKDIRKVRRFTTSELREIINSPNRIELPEKHYLRSYGLLSLPEKITSTKKIDTVDTPENRFVKHALDTFLKFLTEINKASSTDSKLMHESAALARKVETFLQHSFFKSISRPVTLKINSPVLQRKEGYREVLKVWLMFDLAAKLIWSGGEDIYNGGKKDIAVLYEYWLFFRLLEMFQSIFDIEQKAVSELIESSNNELNLTLKQGKHTAFCGVIDTGTRKLIVRFNYNRTFSGRNTFPNSGSWTTTMRPDYTLSIWPNGIVEDDDLEFKKSEVEAERQELIVHIHFDAKYKVANLKEFLGTEGDLDKEKINSRKGIYKNADLLKMHAYKDAIRRTGGAYVLYPGDTAMNRNGFHEIIPGLGAFPVRPSKTDTGISDLKAFILEVLDHFINRASQRERLSYRIYDIHKDVNPKELKDYIPEAYGENRSLIPDETFVLIGFYNSEDQYKWIEEKGLYNFRMGSGNGSLELDQETVSAKFLLLHTHGEVSSSDIWKIYSRGPRVFSNQDLVDSGYINPSQDNYLVIRVEKIDNLEFNNACWDFRKLENYKTGSASAFPFTANVTELMSVKIDDSF